MWSIVLRDILIGYRDFKPIMKWIGILCFTVIMGAMFLPSKSEQNTSENHLPALGICCSDIKLSLTTNISQKLFAEHSAMSEALKRGEINITATVRDDTISFNGDKRTFSEIRKDIQSSIESSHGPLSVILEKSVNDNTIPNAIWVFVCLVSLIPLTLSDSMIGNDFRSGRLSEVMVASGSQTKVIIGKIFAIASLSILICLVASLVLGTTIAGLITSVIVSDPQKIAAIAEAANASFSQGDFLSVFLLIINLGINSGVVTLIITTALLCLQVSSIILMINLLNSKNTTKKTFLEKVIALIVWLPIIVPLPTVIASCLPIYSAMEVTRDLGPDYTMNLFGIAVNTAYIGIALLISIMISRYKRDWPSSN